MPALFRASLLSLSALALSGAGLAAAELEQAETFLERHCLRCHGGEKVKGKVDFTKAPAAAGIAADIDLWETAADVVEFEEMPPEDEPQPTAEERGAFLAWYRGELAPVTATPAAFQPRRLSSTEYRNTLRSLFGFDLEVAIAVAEQTISEKSLVKKLLPTDPPGASGYINNTHGAALSPVLWDQYSYLADTAIAELFSPNRRGELAEMLGASLPGDFDPAQWNEEQTTALLSRFLPRAFRRPLDAEALEDRLSRLRGKKGEPLLEALQTEMKTALMSPAFLYRGFLLEGTPGEQQPVDPFELAERLSYFLWEDMPDAELFASAKSGRLSDPGELAAQVDRMLQSPRARSLSESFGTQWLTLDEIDEAARDATTRASLKSQPIDFLDYLFTENRPVLELIDSGVTFASLNTASFYGKDRQQLSDYRKPKGIERIVRPNERIVLEHAEGRGGILTMPGILAMNHGPILRGTWMLRKILGEHLGEPPADVPPIQPAPPGTKLTFREKFERHRADATCARCHDKIDPLGFALQAYDDGGAYLLASYSQGKKKTNAGEEPIDTSGKLPSGEAFTDFEELKELLLTARRRDIVRNAVEQVLAYALCRKLELHDRPAVEEITDRLLENDGTWRDLFHEVTASVAFRETILTGKEES